MRTAIFWIATFAIFGTVNAMIARKEITIRNGTTMLVDLAPRDPRSLMQGDYMTLRYRLQGAPSGFSWDPHGRFVVRVYKNSNNVAFFVRVHNGEELKVGERLLRYRYRETDNSLQIGSGSYFFQEGQGHLYANARWGEFKVSDSGDAILVGLRNRNKITGLPE